MTRAAPRRLLVLVLSTTATLTPSAFAVVRGAPSSRTLKLAAKKGGGFGQAAPAAKKKKKAAPAFTTTTPPPPQGPSVPEQPSAAGPPSVVGEPLVQRESFLEPDTRMPDFMRAFRIPEHIVDGVLDIYESAAPVRGMVSTKGGGDPVVDPSVKDSLETAVAPNDARPAWKAYVRALRECASLYTQDYPFAAAYGVWALTSPTNIQRYPPSGGYKTFHTERTGAGQPEGSRHLVFMTYLNDVTDAGGTEFYHQNVTISPVKGRTLIWPADWTFTHRGVPSPTQEKTITTGWFNYVG